MVGLFDSGGLVEDRGGSGGGDFLYFRVELSETPELDCEGNEGRGGGKGYEEGE